MGFHPAGVSMARASATKSAIQAIIVGTPPRTAAAVLSAAAMALYQLSGRTFDPIQESSAAAPARPCSLAITGAKVAEIICSHWVLERVVPAHVAPPPRPARCCRPSCHRIKRWMTTVTTSVLLLAAGSP
jgi:hypothetical protein